MQTKYCDIAKVPVKISHNNILGYYIEVTAKQNVEKRRIQLLSPNERHVREKGNNEYVFYDGPPFANGLPHYGHLVTIL